MPDDTLGPDAPPREPDFAPSAAAPARALAEGRADPLDRERLAAEIGGAQRAPRKESRSRRAVLLRRRPNGERQPGTRACGRRVTIPRQRQKRRRVLADSPSPKARPAAALPDVRAVAGAEAALATGRRLDPFPETGPRALADVPDDRFRPGPRGDGA